jgi:hypothetical protein
MQLANGLKDKAAIVGIGQTEFSKRSGRTELKLAIEAIGAALDDCGLHAADVDGMSLYTMENNPANEVIHNLGGADLRFFSRIHLRRRRGLRTDPPGRDGDRERCCRGRRLLPRHE